MKISRLCESNYNGQSGQTTAYWANCIPTGTYTVIVNQSPRFGRKLPRLLGVPGHVGILIHSGNTPDDTSGCILVGMRNCKGDLESSRATMDAILSFLNNSKDEKTITITDVSDDADSPADADGLQEQAGTCERAEE